MERQKQKTGWLTHRKVYINVTTFDSLLPINFSKRKKKKTKQTYKCKTKHLTKIFSVPSLMEM